MRRCRGLTTPRLPREESMNLYVVAISQKEASEIAKDRPDVCHETRVSAERHLKAVKAPPTDPYYANQYRIYKVKRKAANETGEDRERKVNRTK
jgi:hypothetical protein